MPNREVRLQPLTDFTALVATNRLLTSLTSFLLSPTGDCAGQTAVWRGSGGQQFEPAPTDFVQPNLPPLDGKCSQTAAWRAKFEHQLDMSESRSSRRHVTDEQSWEKEATKVKTNTTNLKTQQKQTPFEEKTMYVPMFATRKYFWTLFSERQEFHVCLVADTDTCGH